jgi:hypothetical protein
MRHFLRLIPLFILTVVLSGCGEESRIKVIVRDFDNSVGTGEVFLTLSSQFFVPTQGTPVDLSTSVVPAGSVRDVVLLDVAESDSLDRYYLYMLEDTVDDGEASAGDQFWPVLELTPKKGNTTELYGFINDTSQSVPLPANPDSRSYFRFDYQISELPGSGRPLYVQLILGSGSQDFTAGSDISIPITNPAALNTLCFFLTSGQSYTYFAFLDMDASGTPTAGDFASASDETSVNDSFTAVSGDIDISISLSGIRL